MKKLNNIIIPVLLVTLSFSTLAFAKKKNRTEGLSGAGEPCEVLTCMAGKLQGDIQPACQPINQRFFNIRVFTPYYNPPATARTRQGFISTCPARWKTGRHWKWSYCATGVRFRSKKIER